MNNKKPLPTPERLNERLDYNESTGQLIWKPRADGHQRVHPWNKRFAGTVAGHTNPNGYLQVCIDYHMLYAHRIVWAMKNGEWPAEGMEVDHINGNREDNRIENLRLCTRKENSYNTRRINKFGMKGVKYNTETNKFTAEIHVGSPSRTFSLGYYDTKEEAHAAYCGAAIVAHREFACFETLEAKS